MQERKITSSVPLLAVTVIFVIVVAYEFREIYQPSSTLRLYTMTASVVLPLVVGYLCVRTRGHGELRIAAGSMLAAWILIIVLVVLTGMYWMD